MGKFTLGVANTVLGDAVLASLRDARDVYDATVASRASELRVGFVEPLCRKYGWRYYAGMGAFFVSVDIGDNTYRPSSPDDTCELEPLKEALSREVYDDLVSLLKVINTDVYSFCHGTDGNPVALLGYYVEDVD